MAAIASLTAILNLRTKGFKAGADVAVRSSNKMTRAMKLSRAEMTKMRTASRDLRASLDRLRTVGFIAVTAATGLATKAFLDFQQSTAAVSKTSNLAGAELENFSKRARLLALELPLSATELQNIAASAAQVGVDGTDNLLIFTETVAKLQTATDLAGQEAVFALARIANATNTAFSDIDRVGSALVELGNNFAATESEIAAVALGVANATRQYDIAVSDILGLATALAAANIPAQVARTAIARVLDDLNKAAVSGGAALQEYARLFGKTVEETAQIIKNSPFEAFSLLLEGLSLSGDLGAALSGIGIDDARYRLVLGTLASDFDGFSRAIETSSKAYEENIALQREFETFMGPLAQQIELVKNRFVELGIRVLQEVEPALRATADALQSIFSQGNLGGIASLTIGLAKFAAILGALKISLKGFGAFGAAIGFAGVGLAAVFTALKNIAANTRAVLAVTGGLLKVMTALFIAGRTLRFVLVSISKILLRLTPLGIAVYLAFLDWGKAITSVSNALQKGWIWAKRWGNLIGGSFAAVTGHFDAAKEMFEAADRLQIQSNAVGLNIPRGDMPEAAAAFNLDPKEQHRRSLKRLRREALQEEADLKKKNQALTAFHLAKNYNLKQVFARLNAKEEEAQQKRTFVHNMRVMAMATALGKAKIKALEEEEEAQKRLVRLEEMRQIRSDAFIQRWKEGLEQVNQTLERQRQMWRDNVEAPILRVAKTIEDGIVGGLSGAQSAAEALGSILNQILDELLRRLIAKPIADFLGNLALQLVGGLAGSAAGPAPAHGGSVYAVPGRASGGPVSGGSPYIVGENGPELFVPQGSGRIDPNVGGTQITINVNGVQDPATVENAVIRVLPRITTAASNEVLRRQRQPGRMRRQQGGL